MSLAVDFTLNYAGCAAALGQATLSVTVLLAAFACQSTSPEPPRPSTERTTMHAMAVPSANTNSGAKANSSAEAQNPSDSSSLLTRPRFAPSSETLEEIAKIRGANWQLFPQTNPPSRLAFFARNLGFISDNAIRAVPIQAERGSNPCRANQLTVDAPREIVTLADQTLLVLGKSTSFVLDSNCQTTRILPRVSYLPGYQLLPEPRWANTFSMFDPASGQFFRFQWDPKTLEPKSVFLPSATIEDSNFRNSACSLMRDGSFACVQGQRLVAGWPGYHPRMLGSIEAGAPVVRVLPADRVDHVRVLRENAELEEYWLVSGAPKTLAFPVPQIPFDVAVGPSYLAILQMSPASKRHVTESTLVVLEADGKLRWSMPREAIPQDLSESDWVHRYFDCSSVAAHPVRPFLAVSTCEYVDVYDARTGQVVQRIERSAPASGGNGASMAP